MRKQNLSGLCGFEHFGLSLFVLSPKQLETQLRVVKCLRGARSFALVRLPARRQFDRSSFLASSVGLRLVLGLSQFVASPNWLPNPLGIPSP